MSLEIAEKSVNASKNLRHCSAHAAKLTAQAIKVISDQTWTKVRLWERTHHHMTGRANKVAINTPEIDFLAQIERCNMVRGGKDEEKR